MRMIDTERKKKKKKIFRRYPRHNVPNHEDITFRQTDEGEKKQADRC